MQFQAASQLVAMQRGGRENQDRYRMQSMARQGRAEKKRETGRRAGQLPGETRAACRQGNSAAMLYMLYRVAHGATGRASLPACAARRSLIAWRGLAPLSLLPLPQRRVQEAAHIALQHVRRASHLIQLALAPAHVAAQVLKAARHLFAQVVNLFVGAVNFHIQVADGAVNFHIQAADGAVNFHIQVADVAVNFHIQVADVAVNFHIQVADDRPSAADHTEHQDARRCDALVVAREPRCGA